MLPSNETLTTLLALPIEARRLLAERAEGPGWICTASKSGPHIWSTNVRAPSPMPMERSGAPWCWLPASEGEILRVWEAVGHEYAFDDMDWHQPLDDRLRAALQCWPGGGGE